MINKSKTASYIFFTCCFLGVDEVNYDLLPSSDFQKKWIRAYLQRRNERLQGEENI